MAKMRISFMTKLFFLFVTVVFGFALYNFFNQVVQDMLDSFGIVGTYARIFVVLAITGSILYWKRGSVRAVFKEMF